MLEPFSEEEFVGVWAVDVRGVPECYAFVGGFGVVLAVGFFFFFEELMSGMEKCWVEESA